MKKLLLIFFGIFCVYLVFLGLKINRFYQKIYTPKNGKIEEGKTQFNFLIFGYGGGKHEGAYLTDTIMIFHVDIKNKKAALVSLPRDLWVPVPTKDGSRFFSKINAIYQMELFPENYPQINPKFLGKKNDAFFTKFIIGKILDIPIDYYAALDFEGFKKAIDILGGVDVDVEKSFTDPAYPIDGKENDLCDEETQKMFKEVEPFLKPGYNPEDKERLLKNNPKLDEFLKNATESPHLAFPCRYETLVFTKGKIHMDGETALKYARSRHSLEDGSDFARARRQHRLLEGVKDKILSLNLAAKAPTLLDQLGNHFKTDFPLSEIHKFSKEALKAKDYQFFTYVFSTQNYLQESISLDGQFILIPKEGHNNWNEIQKAIKIIFEGIDPQKTPTPTTKVEVKRSTLNVKH